MDALVHQLLTLFRNDLCWARCRNRGKTYYLAGDRIIHLCKPCQEGLVEQNINPEYLQKISVPVTELHT